MKMRNVFLLLVCFLFISGGVLKGCAGGSSDNPATFKAICAVTPDDEGEPESDDCSSGGIGGQTLNLATQRTTSPGIFITLENSLTNEVNPDTLNDIMLNNVRFSYPNNAGLVLNPSSYSMTFDIDAGGGTALIGYSAIFGVTSDEATYFELFEPFTIDLTITYSGTTGGGTSLMSTPFVFPIYIYREEPSSDNSFLSASAATVEEESSITVTVTVLDSNNTAVQGAVVVLTEVAGTPAGDVSISPGKGLSDENGEVEFTVVGVDDGNVVLYAYWASLSTPVSADTLIDSVTITVEEST